MDKVNLNHVGLTLIWGILFLSIFAYPLMFIPAVAFSLLMFRLW